MLSICSFLSILISSHLDYCTQISDMATRILIPIHKKRKGKKALTPIELKDGKALMNNILSCTQTNNFDSRGRENMHDGIFMLKMSHRKSEIPPTSFLKSM